MLHVEPLHIKIGPQKTLDFFFAVRHCDCRSRSKDIKGCDNKMADRRSREHIKPALALSKQHVLRQRVGLQQVVSELMLLSLCQTAPELL